LITQQLSEHSQAPVVTTPQPALDAAVGAALFAAFGADADAKTGVAPVLPVDVPEAGHAPGSATFRALAWSQDDDTADDVVPYTGDVYDTGGTVARPSVQYVPATEPIEEPQSSFNRLPQLVFGLAAVVAVVAVGGVAVALTSASDSTKATEPPITATSVGPTSVAPPPSTPPPVQTVTVTSEPPPPPPPTTTVPPPVTHIVTMTPTTTEPTTTTTATATTTTTSPTTTTTTPTTTETTTTTTTTPPMTTSYITVPFVPVPIPIQVPNQGPQTQAPQYPYQAPQYPYQYQQPQQVP
jgi:hypothetical protein